MDATLPNLRGTWLAQKKQGYKGDLPPEKTPPAFSRFWQSRSDFPGFDDFVTELRTQLIADSPDIFGSKDVEEGKSGETSTKESEAYDHVFDLCNPTFRLPKPTLFDMFSKVEEIWDQHKSAYSNDTYATDDDEISSSGSSGFDEDDNKIKVDLSDPDILDKIDYAQNITSVNGEYLIELIQQGHLPDPNKMDYEEWKNAFQSAWSSYLRQYNQRLGY